MSLSPYMREKVRLYEYSHPCTSNGAYKYGNMFLKLSMPMPQALYVASTKKIK